LLVSGFISSHPANHTRTHIPDSGLDLHGNTYWEFRLSGSSGPDGRWRRIVQYPAKTHHGDVAVSPAWHQWLRNTRKESPSLDEQAADVARQERMKVLAAQADARWTAKPSLLESADAPGQPMGQRVPALGAGVRQRTDSEEMAGTEPKPSREETWRKMQEEEKQTKGRRDDPWAQKAPTGPSEQWQPKSWQPPATPRP